MGADLTDRAGGAESAGGRQAGFRAMPSEPDCVVRLSTPVAAALISALKTAQIRAVSTAHAQAPIIHISADLTGNRPRQFVRAPFL